jgi:hypothetical protein
MYGRLTACLFVVAALGPAPAPGADQHVLGSVLIVKNPSTPGKRRIVVRAREQKSDDTLVGDPVTNGASVTITASGATSSSGTYPMPAGTGFWRGDSAHGFRYGDPHGQNGAVRSALIRSKRGVFQIRVNVDGRLGAVDVVPPNTGSDGCVLLTIAGVIRTASRSRAVG